MIANKREFFTGTAMLVLFFVVLALFFAPIYNGHNGLAYLDNLYNSISKYSANYLEETGETAAGYRGQSFKAVVRIENPAQAERVAHLFTDAGTQVTTSNEGLTVAGDLGVLLEAAVSDSELAYGNDGQTLLDRHGVDARTAMYAWWTGLNGLEKSIKKQKLFDMSKDIGVVISRGVEPAYNYYGVEAQSISSRLWVVIFSLAFYVIYTLWYGFAILFMFEGWGLKLEH